MDSEIDWDPIGGRNGLSFTPFHVATLLFAALSLYASQLKLTPEMMTAVKMWQRVMVLLVGALVLHHLVSSFIAGYRAKLEEERKSDKAKMEKLTKRAKVEKKPNLWENESAHPSQFLTTKDGKPRLFPFPLGKAGGNQALKGELWWEAGNSAHVGHFNQRETPEAKEQMRLEMEDKEDDRVKKARKAMKEYNKTRSKWLKRMAHLKVVSGIVVIALFHRPAAVICLAAYIYYVIATEIAGIMKVPEKDKKDEDEPAKKRRKMPTSPGMGMTYVYEPTANGGVAPAASIPVKAPTHRLMTSLDSRYAS